MTTNTNFKRWEKVDNYAETQRAFPIVKKSFSDCEALLDSRIFIGVMTCVFTIIILLLAKPPFICARKDNDVLNNNEYTEKVSLSRIMMWTLLVFICSVFGHELLHSCSKIKQSFVS